MRQQLGSLQVRVFWGFLGKIHFVLIRSGHVNVDIDTYTYGWYAWIRHLERSSWQSYQFTTASIFWKISKHSNIQRLCKGANALWASLQKSHRHVSQTSLDSVIRRRRCFWSPKEWQTWSLGFTSIGSHIWYLYSWMQFRWKSLYKKYPWN